MKRSIYRQTAKEEIMANGVITRGERFAVERAVTADGLMLEDYPQFQADRHIVNMAIQANPLAIQFADPKLQTDPLMLEVALMGDGAVLELAPDELKNDKNVVLAAIESNAIAMKHANSALLDNKLFMIEALTANIKTWDMLPIDKKRDSLALLTVHRKIWPNKCIMDIKLDDSYELDQESKVPVGLEFARKFKAYFETKINLKPDFAILAQGYGIPFDMNAFMKPEEEESEY